MKHMFVCLCCFNPNFNFLVPKTYLDTYEAINVNKKSDLPEVKIDFREVISVS